MPVYNTPIAPPYPLSRTSVALHAAWIRHGNPYVNRTLSADSVHVNESCLIYSVTETEIGFVGGSRVVFTAVDQIAQTLHYSNARLRIQPNWASSFE